MMLAHRGQPPARGVLKVQATFERFVQRVNPGKARRRAMVADVGRRQFLKTVKRLRRARKVVRP
jgi:hypothetical protein